MVFDGRGMRREQKISNMPLHLVFVGICRFESDTFFACVIKLWNFEDVGDLLFPPHSTRPILGVKNRLKARMNP